MANLRWFRKHQKVMLVVFGVVLMAVFGLGSVISMMPAGGGGQRSDEINEVVAKWNGGQQICTHFHYSTSKGSLHLFQLIFARVLRYAASPWRVSLAFSHC